MSEGGPFNHSLYQKLIEKFMHCDFEFKKILRNWSFGVGIFFAALLLGPVRQLDFFSKMPGDFIDARLNLYFLETILVWKLSLRHFLVSFLLYNIVSERLWIVPEAYSYFESFL